MKVKKGAEIINLSDPALMSMLAETTTPRHPDAQIEDELEAMAQETPWEFHSELFTLTRLPDDEDHRRYVELMNRILSNQDKMRLVEGSPHFSWAPSGMRYVHVEWTEFSEEVGKKIGKYLKAKPNTPDQALG